MPKIKTSRKEIIAKCVAVFNKNGYYNTSIADLANEIGLTKGVLYHHFIDKRELMKVSLQSAGDFLKSKNLQIINAPDLSAVEKMEQLLNLTKKLSAYHRGGCFFANTVLETAHSEDTFLPIVNDFFTDWNNSLVKLLKSKHSDVAAQDHAERIINDIEGAFIRMQVSKDESFADRAIARAIKLL